MTSFLVLWVRFVSRNSKFALALICAATLVLGWVAVTQFRINSDLSQLIDQTSDWRVDFDDFQQEFPELVKTAVIVISSSSITDVETVTKKLVERLEQMEDRFSSVVAPGAEPFFRDHALLYLNLEQFDGMVDRLAQAQPLVARMAVDARLGTAFDLLQDAIENGTDAPLEVVTEHLLASGEAVLAGTPSNVRWADVFFANDSVRYQLIYVKPKSSFDATLPDAEVMAALRTLRDDLTLPSGVRVQFTGEIPLQHEEIEAAITGVTTAGWLALVLLFLVLIVGVRSAKIIIATFSMLAIGVLWTSAYAMLTVGEYNTLSIVFVVMFFGLGVDFALHFSLRFQEAVNRGDNVTEEALLASTRSVGRAIALCSLTTAVGFMGFFPTAYQGLADLGVISAGGMVIAAFLTFTFLPAFYTQAGQPSAHEMDLPTSEGIVRWLLARRRAVLTAVVMGGLVAAYGTAKSSFDYSVLAIKDPDSESMLALRELQREGLSTDYQLAVVSSDPLDPAPLEALGVVREVFVPQDRVPLEQIEKLEGLEDLQLMYWDFLDGEVAATNPKVDKTRAEAAAFQASVVARGIQGQEAELAQLLERFAAVEDDVWREWQAVVLDGLLLEMQWLQRALTVAQVGFDDLPESIRNRLVGSTGRYLTVIQPEENIAKVEALSEFITATRALQPTATGRPVIEWGVGQIVIGSFQQALLYAFIGIGLILLLVLRGARTATLVLFPLVLAALCSFAIGVVIGMPLNMANILVLPLIFGLGVDNGIHVVDRYFGEGDVDHLMHSSTPRAVVLSTMTTIGAFAALSISPHMGTASIGVLLTISIGFLLLFTVFLLPVLLAMAGTESSTPQTGKVGKPV
ncbi:MAG: MMPL family transporter [Pseudomonadales bacterium]|nr:MMPL family transporter [Pseudomonadales bacterium]